MGTHLKLPALWSWLENRQDPRERLEQLHADVREAKAELREVLERLAERHGICQKEVTYAIEGYADDMLSDLVYAVGRELEREIERRDPV
jgi:hypothetical protein